MPKLDNYYLSLARSMMVEAQSKLEKAEEYLALAARKEVDGSDWGLISDNRKAKHKVSSTLERIVGMMKDRFFSE